MTVDLVEMDELASKGEAALAHFGVLGMKWGVRRSASELATRKADLVSKRGKANVKSTTALSKQSKIQTKTMERLATGKKVTGRQRRKLRKANRRTVRSLRKVRKYERKIRRTDTKIKKMEQQTIDAGKRAAEAVLDGD